MSEHDVITATVGLNISDEMERWNKPKGEFAFNHSISVSRPVKLTLTVPTEARGFSLRKAFESEDQRFSGDRDHSILPSTINRDGRTTSYHFAFRDADEMKRVLAQLDRVAAPTADDEPAHFFAYAKGSEPEDIRAKAEPIFAFVKEMLEHPVGKQITDHAAATIERARAEESRRGPRIFKHFGGDDTDKSPA